MSSMRSSLSPERISTRASRSRIWASAELGLVTRAIQPLGHRTGRVRLSLCAGLTMTTEHPLHYLHIAAVSFVRLDGAHLLPQPELALGDAVLRLADLRCAGI